MTITTAVHHQAMLDVKGGRSLSDICIDPVIYKLSPAVLSRFAAGTIADAGKCSSGEDACVQSEHEPPSIAARNCQRQITKTSPRPGLSGNERVAKTLFR